MAVDDELARTATAPSSSSPPGPAADAPTLLGKYRLERELGAGGMGVVHAAFDPDLERRVAIKLLRDEPGTISRQRLLREARAMARLAHPNVVTVHEVGTIEGRDFVAMELIDGQSLAEWLRGGKHKNHEIIDAFIDAGTGLAAAHAEGLVHRDFKPHNVLRSKRGRVLVTDFGLARGADAVGEPVTALAVAETTPRAPMLTATGAIVGTPAYMAPEQWSGGAVGPATDQFAYCVALWEALAGERPFRGDTGEQLRAAVARGTADLDTKKLPRSIRSVLLRGLSADPAKRFPSMDALLAAIAKSRDHTKRNTTILVAIVTAFVWHKLGSSPSNAPGADPNLAAVAGFVTPKTHDQLVASIAKRGPDAYTVPRATVEQLVTDRERMFGDDVKLTPQKDGESITGYRLYAIRPGSIFHAFGLEDTDVLASVDGIAITSTDKLVEIYKDVRAAKQVTVDYVRHGEVRHLAIAITP